MNDDYNEHESGDEDGLGCCRGLFYAILIQLVVFGSIWLITIV